jgi:hypothetical protein
MKSSVTKPEPEIVPIKFPCIMEYQGDFCGEAKGMVVMFEDETCGVCLYSGTSSRKVGLFLDTWVSAYDNESWKPFKGSITIEV